MHPLFRKSGALLALAFAPLAARAQMTQFSDDDASIRRVKPDAPAAPAAPEKVKPGKTAEPPAPISPNRIVGRILWVDAQQNLCVVSLDGSPFDRTATLVARTLECKPRAVLAPVPSGRTSATAAYRVTHGAATKDLELILPCQPALNAACVALPRVTATDAAPKKN